MHRRKSVDGNTRTFALDAFYRLKPEKRRKLLNAAIFEFAARGYEGAGMQQIAREAGISVGALYRYFRGKEELFLFIASLGYSLLHNLARSVALAALSFRESIRSLFRLTQEYSLKYPELTRVYLNLGMIADHGQVARLNQVLEGSFLGLYEELFDKARQNGEIPAGIDSRLAAFALDNQLIMLQHTLCSDYYRERRKAYLGEGSGEPSDVSPGGISFEEFLVDLTAGVPSEADPSCKEPPDDLPRDLADLCLRMFSPPAEETIR